ncbi:MAG: S-layer homology domain-containing protein [Clostridia bacterium]|nr:S-layer homology domain-containing protein [Clostridia bacterium]
MRNLKKVLALVLVFAMMLSTCVVASAASFPDVAASYQYAEAVDLLASLNILGGYEDGTFKPENNITRAEFAKVVYVIFNGMDDVNAQMYVSDSQFNDVAKNQWFNGHVNWASENSIVGGYGDGTFLPSNNVAVKEAIKMVVTAVTDKALTYPNGYIQEARALKLLDDVTIASIDAPATRGQVAQLAYNLLFTPSRLCLVDTGTMDFYGNEILTKKAPLEFVFGLTPVENVTLEATYENAFVGGDTNLEEGQVKITGAKAGKYDYAGDVNDLFGQTLKAYFNSNNELVALVSVSAVVEETTADKLAGRGTVDAPYGKITGEYITYTGTNGLTKGYGVKNVYTQSANGQYAAYNGATVTAQNGENYILLDSFYEAEYWNNGGKVTLIDNPVVTTANNTTTYTLDGVVDTVIIDFQGAAKVERYAASSKTIKLANPVGNLSFEKAIGHEAFADADYTDITENPTFASYTVKTGSAGTIYTLAPVTTAEGVLTSVDTNKNTVIVGGTTYAAFGKSSATLFDGETDGIGNTLKLFLDANGYVVGYVVTEAEAVYDLNLGKVVAAADEADAWGNNVKATLTVVTPDGTEKVLTIDTTVNSKVGDDVACVFDGRTAAAWVDTSDANEVYFDYTVDQDLTDGNDSNYTIVGEYIHYEVDDATNEVVRVVALGDLNDNQPTGTKKVWTATQYSDNLCYKTDLGFYTSSDTKGETVTGTLGYPADAFVGMFYEENEDGELETAYYTASNIPAFANKGDFTLIWADDDLVAMVVTDSPDAVADNKVLGIVTGFATVAGESEKNGKPTYRTEVTMLVNGESQKFYTEDVLADDLAVVEFDELDLTGLTTDQLAYLQLQSDGKIEVNAIAGENYINIEYVQYADLTFAIATAVRGSYVTATEVVEWTNPVIAGWTTDAEGKPVYNEQGFDGTIKLGDGILLDNATPRVCNETTYITISGTPADVEDTAVLFQKTTSAQLSAGGQILKSDAKNNSYNVFAFTTFGVGEAVDSDNDGALKTVFVFDTSLDAIAE